MESIWQKDTELPAFPKFQGSCGTDVLIIGGGMAGILTAYFLNNSGAECILLEKNRILSGTTSGTTAKITFQHGLIYNKLIRKKGVESAGLYLQAHKSAFEMFENLCKNIDCDFEYRDSYIYSLDDREKLEQEISACEKIGFNAEYCENIPLPFETAGAVKFSNQAQFNPLKFVSAVSAGLNIYEHTRVRELVGTTALTNCGTISANRI
ncbi:MAG: FAD-dependent oxidoreductase, partial [Ruminococcus sp.]|nr:FAD-dependent oxidoreductase [Ruminococcus sp.]